LIRRLHLSPSVRPSVCSSSVRSVSRSVDGAREWVGDVAGLGRAVDGLSDIREAAADTGKIRIGDHNVECRTRDETRREEKRREEKRKMKRLAARHYFDVHAGNLYRLPALVWQTRTLMGRTEAIRKTDTGLLDHPSSRFLVQQSTTR